MTVNSLLRLRQICLLARDLEWTSNLLCAAFDAQVVFRDPRMAAGGELTNTHIRLGDSFLETVSPSDFAWEASTTQTRLLERNGDCGYMAIVQVPDVAIASQSMAAQGKGIGMVSGGLVECPGSPGSGFAGVKSRRYVVGEPLPKRDGFVAGINVQFHPSDFGTLAEIQENWPGHESFPRNKGAYFPAGNSWQRDVDARPHGGVTTGFAAVEIAPRGIDPAEVCKHWQQGLGAGCWIDEDQPAVLQLAAGQTMRFVEPGTDGRSGVIGVDLWNVPGATKKFESLDICGVTWRLVEPST
ncbi:MAG: hypothetical protein F4W90_08160 [Gammaproteobacteria bacterium]|nr:hypothetical protein [Gammaproteobacteria bacterium]